MFGKIAELIGIKKNPQGGFIRRSILVVDDNKTDLMLMKRTIEKIGHRALIAENGKAGWEVAKAEKPDLILSDCHMPEANGVEMYKRLGEDEETKNIPVVFLTSVDQPAMVIECFDMGAHNYICKPISPKLLASQIQSIFKECLSA